MMSSTRLTALKATKPSPNATNTCSAFSSAPSRSRLLMYTSAMTPAMAAKKENTAVMKR